MIEIKNLSKSYDGVPALRDATFRVNLGDMFGLIGPNGAGKTTLIRILATLLRPTSGIATVNGKNVVRAPKAIRRMIGYMPDFFGVYEDLKVQEYLEFFAAAYGLRGHKKKTIIADVLELTDLGKKRRSLIGTLSRGMQQRLGLARVLVHDPQVLLLDEPASGLDPRARIEIRELLKELRNMGKTILISSHILADLEDICNRIALLEKGRLIYAGGLKEAMAKVQRDDLWVVEVFEEEEKAKAVLAKEPYVKEVVVTDGQLRVQMEEGSKEYHRIPQALLREGLRLRLFKMMDVSLEDAFLRLTKGEVT